MDTQSQPATPAEGPSPGAQLTRPVQPAKQDRATLALLVIAALVAVGGIGFALGHVTAPSAAAGGPNATGRGGFGGAFRSFAPGTSFVPGDLGGGGRGLAGELGGGVSGTVQSVTPTTMTVQLANGTVVTIDLSGNTTYHGETSASASQVTIGTSVTVQIDTATAAGVTPNPNASGGLNGRTLTAKDVLITNP